MRVDFNTSRQGAHQPADEGRRAETCQDELDEDEIAELFMDDEESSEERSMADKRKGEDQDEDHPDKKHRPRSPTVSYNSDGPQMDDQMLSGMNATDRRILSAAILGVDLTEVFSPERIAKVARQFGLTAGTSMDLTTGWDFTKDEHRRLAWGRVKEESPYVLVGSPPCTYFSVLQELNKAAHGDKPGWLDKFNAEKAKAIKHIEFCCALYRYQLQQGRHFVHEHPWTARSWALPCVQKLLDHPSVEVTQAHMCRFMMTTHVDKKDGEVGLVKKPTGFMTSSHCILKQLDRKCTEDHVHVPLMGGRAAGAAIYPQMLCEAVCRGIAEQKRYDQKHAVVSTGRMSHTQVRNMVGHLCSIQERSVKDAQEFMSIATKEGVDRPVGDYPENWLDTWHEQDGGMDERGVRPQMGVTLLKQEMDGLSYKSGYETAWDDVTNAELQPGLVRAARKLEMDYFERLGVYERVPRSHQVLTGGIVIGVRWVDVNKGDASDPEYRSRLVGREFAVEKDDALYAATPPLEALRLIISHAGTDTESGGRRALMINDVRRAYFYAKIQRDVYIELPAEDDQHGKGMLGKLRLCLYGTRDAAKGWQETLSAHLVSIGFERGKGHPSVFQHPTRGIKTLVHGDDYVSSGDDQDLSWLEAELEKAYELKTQRLGTGIGSKLEGKVLNRVLRCTPGGWELEADPRHAELIIEQLGLGEDKGLGTPGVFGTDEDDKDDEVLLTGTDITQFRGVIARCNYLGSDRPDCQFAIKEGCREMSKPTMGSLRRLRHIGRFLKRHPRLVWHFDQQPEQRELVVRTDADWAGCRRSRKSTSGGNISLGGHTIKTWAKTQAVIAKSSAESELYGVVRGACEALGVKTLCKDLGSEFDIRLELDATAAKGILDRQGIAKVRHIDVNCLWLQEQCAKKMVPLVKVPGETNTADLMTKHLANPMILRHLKNLNMKHSEGRAGAAAQLHSLSRRKRQSKAEEKKVSSMNSLGNELGKDFWSERGEHGRWVRVHKSPRTL